MELRINKKNISGTLINGESEKIYLVIVCNSIYNYIVISYPI